MHLPLPSTFENLMSNKFGAKVQKYFLIITEPIVLQPCRAVTFLSLLSKMFFYKRFE